MKSIVITLTLFLSHHLLNAQRLLVSSRGNHSVKQYDLLDGAYINDFIISGYGGLSLPQELIWHPDGFLLVVGRGNTAIKKYEGYSGEYLGEFTSGYSLDNPTKTTLGPDSLLYVSQWGSSQNKIARFNFKTGAFVDEFTKVGINNAGSQAWDSAGNLYVVAFGAGNNGHVLRFDTAGNLHDTFIKSPDVLGPIYCWFNAQGDFLVQDWSSGSIKEFNALTGEYIKDYKGGLKRMESYLYYDKYFYVGDWLDHIVYRMDTSSKLLQAFLFSGNLSNPNAMLLAPDEVSVPSLSNRRNKTMQVYPSPAGQSIQIPDADVFDYRIYNTEGKELLQGKVEYTAQPIPVEFLQAGLYWILLKTEEGDFQCIFYKQ